MALQVELVSPERILYSGEAEMVVCRTPEGEVAFLTGHAPFLGSLEPGVVKVKPVSGEDITVTIGGGFVEVRDDKVSILSDAADIEGAPTPT